MKERTPAWILSEPTCVMDQRSGTRAGPVIGSVRGVNASAVRTLRGRRKQNTEDVSFGSFASVRDVRRMSDPHPASDVFKPGGTSHLGHERTNVLAQGRNCVATVRS